MVCRFRTAVKKTNHILYIITNWHGFWNMVMFPFLQIQDWDYHDESINN